VVYDIFNKNPEISKKTISLMITTIENTPQLSNKFVGIQMSSVCVFLHIILLGARSDQQGFGCANDLVNRGKVIERNRMNEIEKKKKMDCAKMLKKITQRKMNSFRPQKDDEDYDEDNAEPVEILDSWEALI
jgi:hypothetical protein